jgi:hypothetical protein
MHLEQSVEEEKTSQDGQQNDRPDLLVQEK